MFTIGTTVSLDLLQEIESELQRKRLPLNKYRTNSGEGYSQCFGIVRQRNGTYTGSRMNFKRPELYDMLIRLGNLILPPTFTYLGVQVNQNYQSKVHKDTGNTGVSAIIGFGDYTEGELVIENTEVCIKNRLVYFDGSLYNHYTKPFQGNRYSIVYHTPNRTFKEVPIFSFTHVKGKLCLTESLSNTTRIYNQKGECAEVQRQKRCPTLRACIE
jgi:hypothetical protein